MTTIDPRVGAPNHDKMMQWIRDVRGTEEIVRSRPDSEYPELNITVPDSWPHIKVAPLYDVHLGHKAHDSGKLDRHLDWIENEPYAITWNGGDLVDNSSKLSVGSGVYENELTPQNQLVAATLKGARLAHKMLFSLPGNHEDRTDQMGFAISSWMSMMLEVPYFPDYCFCTISWRGNKFRILAHHGSGSAGTAGAQRTAARKDIAWAKPFDLYWTGHLHNPLVDPLYQTDRDQRTGEMFDRNGFVIISPSYLKYFGTYAAKKRYTPGARGLGAIVLQEDGRIDASMHANGKRL